ncbi:replication initiation protein [Undibacterium sp. SXout7W]|uniref:replication initiation protein n=1 Tax=Undibacterium sp. SXout7W TaxID=3413049 RepID=UPI003BF3E90A
MATKNEKTSKSSELVASDVSQSRQFRKTNDAIGLRVTEGKLTLLTRKVFNVMMYHAQELKVPGKNAPIDSPSASKYFWIPLSDLAKDAAYDSKDTEFLKQQLEELQNIKLLMENERQWTSERLVSSVTLVNPTGFKKHGGQVWFGYAFPPEVHELVMVPGTYTRFNIFYQGLLRSGSALALYEICRRYATNPSKRTLIESYEHWYGVLTGNAVEREEPPPYKYFKRDVIKPAIAQINALTDINIELVELKNGRRIDRLQFIVQHAQQPQLAFPAPPVIDLALIERIMKFGFSQQESTDFVAQHSDETIQAAISFVENRQTQKNSPKLDSPAAYFRWTLKKGASAAQEQLQNSVAKLAKPKAGDGQSVMEKFLAARAQEALDVYKELDDDERKQLFDRFKKQNSSATLKLDKGIDSPTVKAMLSHWYAKELWGEPTADALAAFIEQSGMAKR